MKIIGTKVCYKLLVLFLLFACFKFVIIYCPSSFNCTFFAQKLKKFDCLPILIVKWDRSAETREKRAWVRGGNGNDCRQERETFISAFTALKPILLLINCHYFVVIIVFHFPFIIIYLLDTLIINFKGCTYLTA